MKHVSRWVASIVIALWIGVTAVQPCWSDCTTDPLDAGIIVVDWQSEAVDPDGRSWPCAYPTLQAGLDRALLGGVTEIWVANGTYTPTAGGDVNIGSDLSTPYGPDDEDRMLAFRLVKNVALRGGFQGISHPSGGETDPSQADPEANVTILSGDLGQDGNAYHVIVYVLDLKDEDPPTEELMIVDGFTITGGLANGGDPTGSAGALNAIGGGALIVFETHELEEPVGPVFSRCTFDDNAATLGGGAYVGMYAGCRIVDCTFESNMQTAATGTSFGKTTRGGGAINVLGPVAILKSIFIGNTAANPGTGGAVHNTGAVGALAGDLYLISNCEFHGNEAGIGGAIHGLGSGTALGTVVNCLFVGNVATQETSGEGGAINTVANVHGCTFVANHAEAPGGAASGAGRVTHKPRLRGVELSFD